MMKVSLVVMGDGRSAGKIIPIKSALFLIGRDPQCHLRPGSTSISKRHCAISRHDGEVYLRDLSSINGTFLNDLPVKGEVPLTDGDVLRVAPLVFRVAIESVAAPKRPTIVPVPNRRTNILDDAAAILLDAGNEILKNPQTDTISEIARVATVADMPSLPDEISEAVTPEIEPRLAESNPVIPKTAEPKKEVIGAAQEAARAILERIRAGKRSTLKVEPHR